MGDSITAQTTTLSLTSADSLFLAYGSGSQKATVRKFENNEWITVGAQDFFSPIGDDVSITRSGTNLFLAHDDYFHTGNPPVLKFNGANWERVGSLGSFSGDIYSSSLSADTNSILYLAYRDQASKAHIFTFSGNRWLSLDPSIGLISYFIKIAVNKGRPYFLYRGEQGYKISVLRYH
jgi:hypothetical protein